jgi:hypothetical protein
MTELQAVAALVKGIEEVQGKFVIWESCQL